MDLSPAILEKLKTYEKLLKKWQEKINLVSPNTIENAWERHFLDSIQISHLIPRSTEATLFDLGCGAGFPGLVLAIMRQDLSVHLIESDQKKCSFLKAVSRETGTAVQIHNMRIEAFESDIMPDIITARALADLSKLFDYCTKWIEEDLAISLVFPKGQRADDELTQLKQYWKFKQEEHQSVTDPLAKIFVFSNITKRLAD